MSDATLRVTPALPAVALLAMRFLDELLFLGVAGAAMAFGYRAIQHAEGAATPPPIPGAGPAS